MSEWPVVVLLSFTTRLKPRRYHRQRFSSAVKRDEADRTTLRLFPSDRDPGLDSEAAEIKA